MPSEFTKWRGRWRRVEWMLTAITISLLGNLVSALREKDQRIAVLEAVIRERVPDLENISVLPTSSIPVRKQAPEGEGEPHHMPSTSQQPPPQPQPHPQAQTQTQPQAHQLSLSPEMISPLYSAPYLAPPPAPPPNPIDPLLLESDYGSKPLSPAMVTFVEEKINALRLFECGPSTHQSSVVKYISSQLGVSEHPDGDVASEAPAAWPPYELALQVVEVFVQTNSMWPIFRRSDLMQE